MEEQVRELGINLGGWITLILSVGGVTFLFGWCIYRVLASEKLPGEMHGMNIDTQDTQDD